MIINEKKSEYFSTNSTGMMKYDFLLQDPQDGENRLNKSFKIRWMHPSEYIGRCAKDIFNIDFDKVYDSREVHTDKISKYEDMMKNGTKFDMPIINYAEKTQEGLHRAISALNLNDEDVIPVMVIYNSIPIDKFKDKVKESEIDG